MIVSVEPGVEYRCLDCGRLRLTRRCGCLGTAADEAATASLAPVETEAARLLRLARIHREAAVIHQPSAAANLADAARLEMLAAGGAA